MNLLQNKKTIRWERIDVRKFMKKFTVAMLYLFILILVEVQANDLVPTSFHPSFSVPLPFSFKLYNS